MNAMPDTDLSTGLVTDSGTQPPAAAADEDNLWAALARLRAAAQTAGLHLMPGYPDETAGRADRLPLGDAVDSTVRELAAILAAAATVPQPAPEQSGIAAAATWLRACAQAAGLNLQPGTPRDGADGQQRLPLGDADHATATRLADLIEQHLTGLYRAEDGLRAALETIGVTPQLTATAGTIGLGNLTVPEGTALLRQLVPDREVQEADPDDQCAGEDLAAHLTDAVTKITGGGRIDAAYTPYCRYCHKGPALLLGRLRPPHAQALTAHLTGAAA